MRWPLAVIVLASASAAAHAQAAPDPDDTGEKRPARIDGRLAGTVAQLTATYEIDVAGPSFGSVVDTLALPPRGVVTGATVAVDGRTHRLALDRADAATAAFSALAERGGAATRPWGVHLFLENGAGLGVDIAAPHAARLELAIEVEVETCYFRDVRYALLPEAWRRGLAAARRVESLGREDVVSTACGGGAGVWAAFPSTELAQRPYGMQRIGTIGGRLALTRAHVAHVELDLASVLSEIPRDLHTAIVVDASRSLFADEAAAQRAIVASYLRGSPQGRVQVIAYARDAHALLPAWTTAVQATPRIERELGSLALGNGSNVDGGLAQAGAWLSRVHGTRRVIVFSDERFAQRLQQLPAAALAKLLPEGTLVHVVVPSSAQGELARDDEAHLAPLAAATEGMTFVGVVPEQGEVDATPLLRPISLDKLVVRTPGWENLDTGDVACALDGNVSLHEGTSCSWWGQGGPAAGPVTVEGFVWGHKLVRIVRPDPAAARTIARILSATASLDEALQKEVHVAAQAVNDVWSLFGTWGGRGGYDGLGGFGRSGWGSTCGCDDAVGTIGHGTGTGTAPPKLPLKAQLAAGVAACHPGKARVEALLETTFEEIADVFVTIDAPELDARVRTELHDCVANAIWNTIVTIPNAPAYQTTSIAF